MRYRLLALDLDGTVVNHDLTIRPRVRHAIAAAQQAGIIVT
ncbi:MAG: HAD hydrolase family protein, partial [Bacteroidota bacterium]